MQAIEKILIELLQKIIKEKLVETFTNHDLFLIIVIVGIIGLLKKKKKI